MDFFIEWHKNNDPSSTNVIPFNPIASHLLNSFSTFNKEKNNADSSIAETIDNSFFTELLKPHYLKLLYDQSRLEDSEDLDFDSFCNNCLEDIESALHILMRTETFSIQFGSWVNNQIQKLLSSTNLSYSEPEDNKKDN